MTVNTDDVIRAYITLRDEKDEIEKRHAAELATINDRMKRIESWLQLKLQTDGLSSLKGPGGTAFLAEVSNCSVDDWEALRKYVEEKNLWPLLDRRASKSAVQEHIQEFGSAPPGVKYTTTQLVRVRRG